MTKSLRDALPNASFIGCLPRCRRSAGLISDEKNITTYNLARMNMLLHGVKETGFEIAHEHGDDEEHGNATEAK